MIVDTSAMVAILFREPEADQFIQTIHAADVTRISAANFVELSMVLEYQMGPDGNRQCDTFLRRSEIVIEPVTLDQAYLARQSFLDFGKGRHPAGLNFGDCFAYALARASNESLLFKGADFSKTDIPSAI